MAKSRIKLGDLQVNTENYRFDSVSSVRVAIDKMIEDQGENLFNLAESIVNRGLNPNDSIIVTPAEDVKNKYIVLEGNRRVVALKILNNPELIEGVDNTSLRKKFKQLNERSTYTLNSEIECESYNDPKEADYWIAVKHGFAKPGVSTDQWNSLQKQRFEEINSGKSSMTLQVMNFINKSKHIPSSIKTNASKISSTNLSRLIEDPNVRSFLGLELNNGNLLSKVAEKEVAKGLTKIVKDILTSEFKVKKIYDREARKKYIEGISVADRPDTFTLASKPWEINTIKAASNISTSKAKGKVMPKDRKKLIPKSCVLSIENNKINAIYHELRDLEVSKFTNATAVLLRVFVELSLDAYIERHKLTKAVTAAKSGFSLQNKVVVVAKHLEDKNLADAAICKGMRAATKDDHSILGIDTWHAYVHSLRFRPNEDSLKLTWDNISDFMIILWNNLK